jgi:hypothetical protein
VGVAGGGGPGRNAIRPPCAGLWPFRVMTTPCLPIDGSPIGLALDGSTKFLWWGPDHRGTDCVAADAAMARAWDTAQLVWAAAEREGWPSSHDRSDAPAVIDLDPAVAWLRGKRATVEPVACLNLWNIAGDVAFSTGQAWADRSRLQDQCYDKLVAANVPWLFGQTTYQPRWTARELNSIRSVLGQGLHVLRAGIDWEPPPRVSRPASPAI